MSSPSLSSLKLVILNSPCMGFGDIIFAIKVASYIRQWYKCTVHIATTQPDNFIKLGEKSSNLIRLSSGNSALKQCRKFKLLKPYSMNGKAINMKKTNYDAIFVAPLSSDFSPEYKDVKSIIPYSDKYNTFFFSEYNDSSNKDFHFHTGVGKGKCGLLLNDAHTKKPSFTKNRYAVVYIAETIDRSYNCFLSFIEMIVKKYSSYKEFEVVVPPWVGDYIKDKSSKVKKFCAPYYDNVVLYDAQDEEIIYSREEDNNGSTLYIRADILPLPNSEMISLMKYSVRDILLTGDQSVTDAISCCSSEKNIFYQIAPWKKSFAQQLSRELPNKYIEKQKTSCGTLKAINYKSNYKKFVKKWDFRRLAKPKMTAIMKMCALRRKSTSMSDYIDVVSHSSSVKSVEDKLYDLLDAQ